MFWANIVCIGGSTQFPGFAERLCVTFSDLRAWRARLTLLRVVDGTTCGRLRRPSSTSASRSPLRAPLLFCSAFTRRASLISSPYRAQPDPLCRRLRRSTPLRARPFALFAALAAQRARDAARVPRGWEQRVPAQVCAVLHQGCGGRGPEEGARAGVAVGCPPGRSELETAPTRPSRQRVAASLVAKALLETRKAGERTRSARALAAPPGPRRSLGAI